MLNYGRRLYNSQKGQQHDGRLGFNELEKLLFNSIPLISLTNEIKVPGKS